GMMLATTFSAFAQILSGPNIPISTAESFQYSPAVAFDGTNYLVVWSDYRTDHQTSDIWGAFKARDGSVSEPVNFPINLSFGFQQNLAVVFGGSVYLVVWEDHRFGIGNPHIFGARVTPQGQVLDPDGFLISS